MSRGIWMLGAAALLSLGCAHEAKEPEMPLGSPPPYPGTAPAPASDAPRAENAPPAESGQATYYGDSLAGHKTANGDRYDPNALTAAHRTLPFGTKVRVTRVDRGLSVVVRINDRGPFGNERRVIDLSRAAAEQLDMMRAGVVAVRVDVVEWPRTTK
jgi:peptidoglycan lytic transglycosylase